MQDILIRIRLVFWVESMESQSDQARVSYITLPWDSASKITIDVSNLQQSTVRICMMK